jgi:hypothetical protein
MSKEGLQIRFVVARVKTFAMVARHPHKRPSLSTGRPIIWGELIAVSATRFG